jgi:histidinol-phosphatase (PHP family)
VTTDLHMHLAPDDDWLEDRLFSLDHVRPYVAQARSRGIAEIGFTEHVYRFTVAREWIDHPGWTKRATADLDAYVACLGEARAAGLPVRAGLELDHVEGREADAAAIAARPEWDYLLGSVHWLGHLQVDHPRNAIWDHAPVREIWERYVDAACRAAATGSYDSMAHPDLAKVFGHRPEPKPLDLYSRLADAFAEAGVCAEVSTAGYRRALAEIYPDPELLAMFHEREVPITLGSDAHTAEGVGKDFDRARRVIHDAGYTTVTAFDRRERRQVPLG